MKKFTFKTEKPTGRFRSFQDPYHEIKLNKVVVGWFSEGDFETKIRLKIIKSDINEDKCPNCPWRQVTLKKTFKCIEEAKQFIRDNNDRIQTQFNLVKDQLCRQKLKKK